MEIDAIALITVLYYLLLTIVELRIPSTGA